MYKNDIKMILLLPFVKLEYQFGIISKRFKFLFLFCTLFIQVIPCAILNYGQAYWLHFFFIGCKHFFYDFRVNFACIFIINPLASFRSLIYSSHSDFVPL